MLLPLFATKWLKSNLSGYLKIYDAFMTQLRRSCDLLVYPDLATIFKNIYLTELGLGCSMQAYLLQGMRNLGSLTRNRTSIPCIARQILNLWTIREVPLLLL